MAGAEGLLVTASWPLAERFQATPIYYLGLAALAAAMVWVGIVAYRSWQEATEVIEPASKDELLEAFRQARNEGELDAGEYERVRRRIEGGVEVTNITQVESTGEDRP